MPLVMDSTCSLALSLSTAMDEVLGSVADPVDDDVQDSEDDDGGSGGGGGV